MIEINNNNIQKQIYKSVEVVKFDFVKIKPEGYYSIIDGSQTEVLAKIQDRETIKHLIKQSQLELIEVIKNEIELNPARFQAEEIALETKDLSFMEGYDRAIKDVRELLTNLK